MRRPAFAVAAVMAAAAVLLVAGGPGQDAAGPPTSVGQQFSVPPPALVGLDEATAVAVAARQGWQAHTVERDGVEVVDPFAGSRPGEGVHRVGLVVLGGVVREVRPSP